MVQRVYYRLSTAKLEIIIVIVFPRERQGNIRAIFGSHLKLIEFHNFNRQRIGALKSYIFGDNHFGCLDLKPIINLLSTLLFKHNVFSI